MNFFLFSEQHINFEDALKLKESTHKLLFLEASRLAYWYFIY